MRAHSEQVAACKARERDPSAEPGLAGTLISVFNFSGNCHAVSHSSGTTVPPIVHRGPDFSAASTAILVICLS